MNKITSLQYLVKDTAHDSASEVWAADGLGTFITSTSAFKKKGVMSPIEKELAARGAFPLRMISRNSSGDETFHMEAVSIDKKSLPDDTFTLPSDYRPFELGNMLGGFGGRGQ